MGNNQTLGGLLRARRKKLNLTTEELAKRAAIDRTYITKIEKENNMKYLSSHSLMFLAKTSVVIVGPFIQYSPTTTSFAIRKW